MSYINPFLNLEYADTALMTEGGGSGPDLWQDYNNFIDSSRITFESHIREREYLTKSTIHKFISIIDQAYDKINQIKISMEESYDCDGSSCYET